MHSFIVAYVVVMLVLIFLYHYEGGEGTTLRDMRMSQIQSMMRKNAVFENLEQRIKEKVKPSKRRSIELLLEQAGLKMNHEEFVILSALSAVVFALIFGFSMNNLLLGIVFAAIGLFVPYQAVGYIRNKRLTLLENQIGSFMKMSISRYENVRDFNKALRLVEREFMGEEPIHSEILKTIREIDVSVPVNVALRHMAERTGNKYMKRFSSYYDIASEVGTETVRHDLMAQAFRQYEEDYQLKRELKKEIAGPVQEAYIMIGAIPAFALYQAVTNDDYIRFMTTTTMGRVGTTIILATLVLIIWFVNTKLGAPVE